MSSDREREYARRGARAALAEIDAQRKEILELFPELATEPGEEFFARARPGKVNVHEAAQQLEQPVGRRKRRVHSDEFKEAAVAKLRAGEYPADVCKAMDIVPSLLAVWAQKARVRVTNMPTEEAARRVRVAKGVEPKNLSQEAFAATQLSYSERLGRETLDALIRHGGLSGTATYRDLAEKENVTLQNMNFRMRVRFKAGHVIKVGKGKYQITKKGRAWFDRVTAAALAS